MSDAARDKLAARKAAVAAKRAAAEAAEAAEAEALAGTGEMDLSVSHSDLSDMSSEMSEHSEPPTEPHAASDVELSSDDEHDLSELSHEEERSPAPRGGPGPGLPSEGQRSLPVPRIVGLSEQSPDDLELSDEEDDDALSDMSELSQIDDADEDDALSELSHEGDALSELSHETNISSLSMVRPPRPPARSAAAPHG
jgi:hypothetical protein